MKKRLHNILEGIGLLFISLTIALVFRLFFADFYKVPSDSMYPTIEPGDFIVVNKLYFGARFYKNFDFLHRYLKIILIFDEVQTGIGRSGKLFCYQTYGVVPDIMTLAKGLGGGVPIGAMLTTNEIATGFKPGDHGSTFGGNPLACAAGNAVMETIEQEGIIDNVQDVSAELFEKLNKLRSKYNCIRSVRGKGLLIGIEFDDTITAQGMREQLFTMGILVSAIGKSTIRLAPPLIITKAQANQFVKALDKILKNTAGPKNVFGRIKDALPTKKQVKESAASIGSAKIDKLDAAGLTTPKDATPDDE